MRARGGEKTEERTAVGETAGAPRAPPKAVGVRFPAGDPGPENPTLNPSLETDGLIDCHSGTPNASTCSMVSVCPLHHG